MATNKRPRKAYKRIGFEDRKKIEALNAQGKTVDEEANSKRGDDIVISTPDSKVTVCVIPTNEELAIARETVALVK